MSDEAYNNKSARNKMPEKIKQNINLSDYTTFKIGGPAKFFVSVNKKEELIEIFEWIEETGEKYFILGGGSNILVNDAGYDGLVIKLDNADLSRQDDVLMAEAGARLSDLVAMSEMEGLSGLEWAAGIPGSVGGAVRGNAGAFGSETAVNLQSVEFFDLVSRQFIVWPKEKLGFQYRSSVFKTDNTKIIWRANFVLRPGDPATIGQTMSDIVALRLTKQPQYPSAGCVFKNLSADQNMIKILAAQDSVRGGKLACGLVVEKLGLKGRCSGGAMVSEDHANFIINRDRAKATDVLALIALIKKEAQDKYHLDVEEEIQLIGF